MEGYKLWVRRNREFVHSLESVANGLTWLLPERFSNNEIGPEAVYAFLGIVGAVNQHIINANPGKCQPPGSEEQIPWSLCISMLKDLETVVEVAAEHFYGKEGKWNFIIILELTKALVRLGSFHDSGYNMLLQGGEVLNVKTFSELPEAHLGGLRNPGLSAGHCGPGQLQHLNGQIPPGLEGRAMAALNKFGDKARMASDQKLLKSFHFKPPAVMFKKQTLSTILSQKGVYGMSFVLGEVISILRPLIYVILIRKLGIQAWKPWFFSLAIELAGFSFLLYGTSTSGRTGDKLYHPSAPEKDEIKRRKLIWALYVMRDPFFTKHTKHRLEKIDKLMNQIPFIGFLTGKIVELLVGAQTRYTYTSGS
ncbi:peroxisome biogenesis protein 16 [Phalaenopsis equestris]|uniref:peroxisome biogenesis protein 16 n=1 Tax=Phalaenopsis equestris TaxID=78828 RepID=UPI0009E1C2AC|nr:peroxisome biogenesis protein 16 [Phalaenopsis equestris]